MSQILDITNVKPIKGEQYFVDTNVWFWSTYVGSKDMGLPNQPSDYQVRDYPQFIERAVDDGAILCHCPMTYTELANIIENTELQIYRNQINNLNFEKKAFRSISDERVNVLKEIDIAWTAICNMSRCLDIKLNGKFVQNARVVMDEGTVDPFDAFYIQIMRENNIDYIITDDHDFCSVNKQIIMTSNKSALN